MVFLYFAFLSAIMAAFATLNSHAMGFSAETLKSMDVFLSVFFGLLAIERAIQDNKKI